MEFTPSYCPNPQCTHYGKHGFGAHLGRRKEEPNDTSAMRALAEGHALRSTGRIVEVNKDTICDWLARAGRHCRAVTTYLVQVQGILEVLLHLPGKPEPKPTPTRHPL
jgi:hypothetical protein